MKNNTFYHSSLAPLCKEHLDELAVTMRPEDRRELWAFYRLPEREGLQKCWKLSAHAVAFIHHGRVAACAGIAPISTGEWACVWSWTGQEAAECPKAFWQASREALEIFKTYCPRLYAVCDERYNAAHRYLRRLGARRAGAPFALAGDETRFALYIF